LAPTLKLYGEPYITAIHSKRSRNILFYNHATSLFPIDNPVPAENGLGAHRVPHAYLSKITQNFERHIGTGGYSNVYMGMTTTRKTIAIKKLNDGASEYDTDRNKKKMNIEIGLMAKLAHPNIIELLGYSNDVTDQLCLIYPYMELTLQSALKFGTLTVAQRLQIARGTARGIQYLHSRRPDQLIHCDIKPANILLDNNKYVLL
jgi:serine/threonine protein kinase